MSSARVIEGNLVVPKGARIAIVASRFNHFIVDHLVAGATDALVRHGVAPDNLTVVKVPGSWEIPAVCARLARSGKFDAVIAAGCVIRGATGHYEHVAGEAEMLSVLSEAERRRLDATLRKLIDHLAG